MGESIGCPVVGFFLQRRFYRPQNMVIIRKLSKPWAGLKMRGDVAALNLHAFRGKSA